MTHRAEQIVKDRVRESIYNCSIHAHGMVYSFRTILLDKYLRMENKEMQGHSECKYCGACAHGNWKHIIIKILVALFIFWAGVQFGELKGMIRAGYSNSGYGYGMMGGWYR